MPAARSNAVKKRRARVRLPPETRRQQLIDVAAKLLTKQGAAGVEIQEVAKLASVTRPVVYRFFPTRMALVQGVLDDFELELSHRFHLALVSTMGGMLPDIVEAFVQACCDAIEAKGKGAWHLMYARGADLEAAGIGRAVQGRMIEPWLPRVAELTGLTRQRVALLSAIVVAAGGAALDGWLEGALTRRDAVRVAARAVTALLADFSSGWPRG
jgi:AcrR family transcriptional regulator